MTDPHGDEEHEEAELLVAVLEGVAQALQPRRVARQLHILHCIIILIGAVAQDGHPIGLFIQ